MTEVGTRIPLPSRSLVRPPVHHRVNAGAPDASLGAAGAHETEADAPQAVAADPAVVDTQLHGSYGDAVPRGHNQLSSTPHRRAGVELSASADPEGWVNHSRPEARRGHAATAVSVAPTGSSVEAWGHRPAAKHEPAGGIPGSAPAGLRREPEPDERLVRCKRCGEVDLPLNDAETWHYVRTGEGMATRCPKNLHGWHDWTHVPLASLR